MNNKMKIEFSFISRFYNRTHEDNSTQVCGVSFNVLLSLVNRVNGGNSIQYLYLMKMKLLNFNFLKSLFVD